MREGWRKFRRTFRHKWLAIPLLLLLGTYTLYVASAWALLSFGGLERLTEKSSSLRLRSDSGYSLWPGDVTLAGGEFVYQDESLTIQILADEAELDLGLYALLERNVHIERFQGKGAKYRMRYLPAWDSKQHMERHMKRIEAFPSIPGFERPPYREPKKPKKNKKRTIVRVENIEAELDEIWIMEYRASGTFRARGGFILDQDVRVTRSNVDLSEAQAYVADSQILTTKKCSIEAELGPFPRRQPKGVDILRSISTDIDCESASDDLDFIQIYPRKTQFEIGGRATLKSDVSIKNGQIVAGRVEIAGTPTDLTVRKVRLPFDWKATIDVKKPGVLAAKGELSLAGDNDKASVENLSFDLASSHEILHRPKLDRISLHVKDLEIRDSQLLRELTGNRGFPALQVHSSTFDTKYAPDAHFNLDGKGSVTLHQKQSALGISADLTADCESSKGQTRCRTMKLDAKKLSYQTEGKVESLAFRVRAEEFASRLPDDMDARFGFEGTNPKSFLKHALGLNFFERLGVNVLPFGKMQGTLHLNKRGTTLAGDLANLSTGKLNVKGRFIKDEALVSSWFVETPLGNYGIHQTPEKTNFKALVDERWYDSCEAKLGTKCS